MTLVGDIPSRDWFSRDVLAVAPDLLGAYLTTTADDGDVIVRITEVEAYRGGTDPGSHAFRGRSDRNAAMFGEPGRLYVYRHLGLHFCVNVVCGPAGVACAVLLRAGEVVDGAEVARSRRTRSGVVRTDAQLASGPARLAVALGIDLGWYGREVTDPRGAVVVRLPHGPSPADGDPGRTIAVGPRVGVGGDGGDGDRFPWRFWLAGEPTVSAYRAATRRHRTSSEPAAGA